MQESLQQQNLKKEEANCIYQHYKGQEKNSAKILLQKRIKERDVVKIPQKMISRKMISKIRI